ncbi:MAG: Nitrate reductase gamma subunit [Syntrophorhabdaceae bacterium PtaU1.Bin034]|nr:MAG: Nitrate reductase gamma subunit [Syntrophorhabdaceae bacterium PtaU1.Bin034]
MAVRETDNDSGKRYKIVNVLLAFIAVSVLFLVGMVGAGVGLRTVFGVVVPYLAFCIFLIGLIYRVLGWAGVPVPFRIPTTCGQQKTLPWVRHDKLDNPGSTMGVIGRMALEVLCFRSLMRNSRTEMTNGAYPVFRPSLLLWFGALAFHWSMLVVVTRHLRFFNEPVPSFITLVTQADGILQVGLPYYLITSCIFLLSLIYLALRRMFNPQVRYLSLFTDYFPLFLLCGVALSGFWLRHVQKADVVAIKELVMGLVSLSPTVPENVSLLFYGHFFLVCTLIAYFPFSKLVHMAGVFLSPTRNMANNTRQVRHINPWDYPVKLHPYDEYENEFREKMKAAGIPVEKE